MYSIIGDDQMAKKQESLLHKVSRLLTGNKDTITPEEHRRLIMQSRYQKSTKPIDQRYAENKANLLDSKKTTREQRNSFIPKYQPTPDLVHHTHKPIEFVSTKKPAVWKPKYDTIYDLINDKRNSEAIQKFSGFVVEQILRTAKLSISNHDLEQLRGFFSLALSEVLSYSFRDQIELHKKVETFVSIAKKVYKVWVYLNDEYDILWDNNIQLVTNTDDEQLAEFRQRHSQIISKYYGNDSGFSAIQSDPSTKKELTIQLPIILEFGRLRTESIPLLEKLIGFTLGDHQIVSQALTCSGFAKEYNDVSQEKILDHDGLGTFGDAVLKSIISEKLFRQNPAITRGELTDAKRELENNPELQAIGLRLDIEKLLLHRNNELMGKKKLATAIEAVVAAIYLSNGLDDTVKFVEQFILQQG